MRITVKKNNKKTRNPSKIASITPMEKAIHLLYLYHNVE
jgi:hypothetical protein